MSLSFNFATAGFSMAAVGCWGASDFIGGYASQRANAFLIAGIGHLSGLIFVVTIALAEQSAMPSARSLGWGLGAGLCGGAALALFYRALSTGRMGLAAPVSAVLGAAIPALFGFFVEGIPHPLQILGFVLAAAGIWVVSRPEESGPPEGIGLAALAGIGFAGFFLCIRQAGSGSAFWIASASRAASLALTSFVVMVSGTFRDTDGFRLRLGVLAGCLDVSGSVLFIRASQAGRLDEAVVLTSLYPVITVLLARVILKEHLTRWKAWGMIAALLAVPMISVQ